MKTTVSTEQSKYPKLMKSSVTNSIYLMTSSETGTKVHTGNRDLGMNTEVGNYFKNWKNAPLTDYDGTVTLSN